MALACKALAAAGQVATGHAQGVEVATGGVEVAKGGVVVANGGVEVLNGSVVVGVEEEIKLLLTMPGVLEDKCGCQFKEV